MTSLVIDRCYESYLISLQSDPCAVGERVSVEEAVNIAAGLPADTLCAAMEEHNEHGRLRRCRISHEPGNLNVEVEAAAGQEEYLAAAIDTISEGMCLLSERYPEIVSVEI